LPADFPGSPPMVPAFDLLTGPAQARAGSNGDPTQVPMNGGGLVFSNGGGMGMPGIGGLPARGGNGGYMRGQTAGGWSAGRHPPVPGKTVSVMRARAACGGQTPGNPRNQI
jgi:hypothetical protein